MRKVNLKRFKRISIIEPLSYINFLNLQKNAKLILTDSGGVQEEACILKVPCVTLRKNTERPETVNIGANIKPVQIIEKLPKGEILNSSLIFIEVVFLNLGGFLFVKSIGIKAIENNKEIRMNGS